MKRALVAIAILTCGLLATLDQGPIGAQEYVSSRLRSPAGSTVGVGTGTATATSGGVLTTSTTQLCTTAVTTEETLWTYTLPANTLNADGRGIRITTWGMTAANANVKTLRVYFGASLSAATHSFGFNNADWDLSAIVLRTGAATEVFRELALLDANLPNGTTGTLTQDTTATIVIKMTGQNGTAAANDLCLRGAVVEAL